MKPALSIKCTQCTKTFKSIPDKIVERVCENHAELTGHNTFETYNPRIQQRKVFSIAELVQWMTKGELPTPLEFRRYDREAERLKKEVIL